MMNELGYPEPTEFMFAYGSNMDLEQMRERAPSARVIATGVMPGYELCFPREGTWRDGGVASFQVCTGEALHGVVYSLSPEDVATMDTYEHPSAYRRVAHDVIASYGVTFHCSVYEAFPDVPVPPHPEYLEQILHAAERFDFPNHYVRRLRNLV